MGEGEKATSTPKCKTEQMIHQVLATQAQTAADGSSRSSRARAGWKPESTPLMETFRHFQTQHRTGLGGATVWRQNTASLACDRVRDN